MERKLIAAAVSSALALPMAAQAVEFSVSGQVNRAIISVDGGGAQGEPDANDGDVQHVDANSSNTKFRFTGSEELDSGMTTGVNLEWAALNGDDDGPTIRRANVYLSTAGGKFTIGQGSTATDGMAFARLGGLSWLGGVTNWCSYAGSGPACASNNGARAPVLRYDTPAIGPASIAISTGENDYFDIKLTIAGSVGDAAYDFRIGHIAEYEEDVAAVAAGDEVAEALVRVDTGTNLAGELLDIIPNPPEVTDTFSEFFPGQNLQGTGLGPDAVIADLLALGDPIGVYNNAIPGTAGTPAGTEDVGDITTMSGAVSFGQGTSVAAAWSQENTGDQAEYQYVELDHSYGDGSIGVYYKTGEYGADYMDPETGKMTAMKGTEGSLWGIGWGHELGGGAAVYAGYRQISEDGMKDTDLLLAGMRVTFN